MSAAFPNPRAERLRQLLAEDRLLLSPCCYDALSARLIEQAGFEMSFMSGFAASASRIAMPDLGLMSYGEVLDHTRNIAEATSLPFVADGDTGYGNAMNVIRTVKGLGRAGAAAVMIEDQVAPKRCGHTPGKAVVPREVAYDRIRAAVEARVEQDVLILARTDARHDHGLGEAMERAAMFHELGADIIFVEAPQSEAEMRRICAELPGPQMANMLEGGATPILPHAELQEIGFRIAAYPLTLLSAVMTSAVETLTALREDRVDPERLMEFGELRERLGFDAYYARAERFES
ncbi:isocitrate lyase/PEP mutase family protein [Roseovarius sp. C7]|uniref:isocitrate lyase/PEP mutase family protein n=1 Tax=Roseovarius sp. C7 TaxID=3398643 RepID=UPI0039F68DE0